MKLRHARRLWQRMRRNYRSKITVAVTLLLVLFMAVGFVEMYCFTRELLLQRTQAYLRGEAASCSISMERTVEEIEDVTFSVLGNDTLQADLRALQSGELDEYGTYQCAEDLREVLRSYALLRTEISAVSLVSLDGTVYSYSKNRQMVVDQSEAYAQEIYARSGRVLWFADLSPSPALCCARAITYLPELEQLGYVTIRVNEADLRAFYEALLPDGVGQVYLLDGDGTVLSSLDGAGLGEPLGEAVAPLLEQQTEGFRVADNGDSVYLGETMSNGWRLALLVPQSYYLSGMTQVGLIFLISALVMAALGGLAVYALTHPLTKPIYALAAAMEDFGRGNLKARSTVTTQDEIGMLSETFNQMVEDMHRLYITAYEKELMRQDTELRALQMQINPHFLYNTLDTINWTARFHGADQVGDMACSLGNLLRYSLAPGDFTVLAREITALRDYLAIQNVRYGEKMTVLLDVPDSFGNIDIPKLMIQPIVENAIVHGIEEKLDDGQIHIWVELEGEDLLLHIDDDGVGMTEETARSLLEEQKGRDFRRSSHIGVYNVHRRIQMYYGEEYGVTIQSRPGEGTRVTLRIKALREPEEEPQS